jgi:hypothetical protein
MCVYSRCFVQCCGAHCAIVVLILWSWQRRLDRLLITLHMCKRVLDTRMDVSTFPGGKAAGAWRWPATQSITEVKETVELHLYSPCVPSWQVVGRTLRFIFHKPVYVYAPAPEASSTSVFMVWLLTYMTVTSEHTANSLIETRSNWLLCPSRWDHGDVPKRRPQIT